MVAPAASECRIFQIVHLQRLAQETETVPAVNQIEAHPYFANNDVRAHGQQSGIATEAWSPIAQRDYSTTL